MKVSYINVEAAIKKMEEIHKQVEASDEFEQELYNDVREVGELLIDAYGAADASRQEMEKDLRHLLDIYFEASDNFKMKKKE